MQFPILIELHRSRLLTFSLLLFHALAASCIVALQWHRLLSSLLLVLIVLSAWHALQPLKILGLRLSNQGGLDCLFLGAEQTTAVVVLPDSAVFNQLVVLRMRIDGVRRVVTLALLPDSMSSEHFRMLRLWLRWRGDAGNKAGINDSVGNDV